VAGDRTGGQDQWKAGRDSGDLWNAPAHPIQTQNSLSVDATSADRLPPEGVNEMSDDLDCWSKPAKMGRDGGEMG